MDRNNQSSYGQHFQFVIGTQYNQCLRKHKWKIHHTTVGSYIQYLCNAFAFYKIRRYNIKGKNIFQVITNIILSTIHYCKDLGALPQTPQNFNRSELCFAKRLCRRIMVSILLRKTVYCQNFATQNRLFRTLLRKVVFDHRIYLCGS